MSDLAGAFRAHFGADPVLEIRVPGRVNLIGEHIDYAGLPVLPAAIDRGHAFLVAPRPDRLVRVVAGPDRPELREFPIETRIDPWRAGDWGNYVKAAVQGLSDDGIDLSGFDALVASDLPVAAGLSSSSALVVGSALAALTASGIERRPLELAALLAEAEQYVGARGGGMDQAAILTGRAGHALHVSFDPLAVDPVPVPEDWRFVVAHSLERAEKSAGARKTYNARRTTIESALESMAPGSDYRTLLAADAVDTLLGAGAARLERTAFRRFRHVVTEAGRVTEAVRALRAGDAHRFGALMLASHASLRDDYEVSTPALDELVERATSAGAYGARLTGAGLGGCIVALVDAPRAAALIASLRSGFYASRGMERRDDLVFPVRVVAGAAVERLGPPARSTGNG